MINIRRTKVFKALPWALVWLLLIGALVEAGAYVWLMYIADDDKFRRFATLSQLREYYETGAETKLRYVPHRYIAYVPAANYGSAGALVYHNSLGYHSPEIPLRKPRGEFRIVCLGGSTTYGFYAKLRDLKDLEGIAQLFEKIAESSEISAENSRVLEDLLKKTKMPDLDALFYSLTYPGYLEMQLHELGYSQVRVINAGAEGYTSWESLINFQLRCLDLDPDMVIVYHGYNDIHSRLVWPKEAYRGDNSGQTGHSSGWYQPLPLHLRSTASRILFIALGRVPSPGELHTTFGTVERTNRFWAYQQQLRDGTYPSRLFMSHPVDEIFKSNKPVYFKRNIENIVLSARNRQVQPVLLTFASIDEPGVSLLNTPEYRAALAEHNAVIKQIGEDMNVHVLDLAAVFPKDPLLFADNVHHTFEGGHLMGKLIADYLVAENIIPALLK